MAGDWIAWVKGLCRRREVIVMAEALGMSKREIAACCMEWWEWCDSEGEFDMSRNCHVRGVTFVTGMSQINEHVGVTGFAEEMAKVGWAVADKNGDLMHPQLGAWTGKAAKERLCANKRKAKQRSEGKKMSRKCHGATVTKTGPEKSRVDNNKKTSSSYNSLPSFSPPSLEEVQAYCRERKNQVDAQRFVDHYTSNGWLVGKAKMKDWRAAVRTWEKNNFTVPATRTARAIGPGQRHPSDLSTEEGTF